ncbi:MgtC/SapB family protein, partial [bacterium]|nr:MgtC/SapB family protein [bacterium]
ARLGVAALLGMLIGAERIFAGKIAGMRTYALVSMGSALFVAASIMAAEIYTAKGFSADPLRMPAQIVTGIGFIGAGLIIFRDSRVRNLTTAAGIWVAAAIGIAAGFGFFALASLATLFTVFIFTVVWYVEQGLKNTRKRIHGREGGARDEDQ